MYEEYNSGCIRSATKEDLQAILQIHTDAFSDEGAAIVDLLLQMQQDQRARPTFSYVAEQDNRVVGHLLFSSVFIEGSEHIPAQILAPVAVAPEYQYKGIGSALVHFGIDNLRHAGIKLLFVLGYPDYYARFGFILAAAAGFTAPHSIPEQYADAWMVKPLDPKNMSQITGAVRCHSVLGESRYWQV